ncbi:MULTISPECIES: RNA polymerase sigma-70 factor [unclassified Flavobacterium]|jgi:RNA polymerase sigma-70 factor (ECF subfamily)|uniref:RNA polymerase sigma-70 factor n=1 Tax=unclassified Flavobacterium TaxID=196869 RepID=UPI00070C0B6F|nr:MULTISPECIES: RNA polymerase sigma-70 factor [unclassified Flavobacterium]KRD61391.1 RNA polymerase subunit sigma-24 [Flavobacterium sp. Root935]MDQ1166599.1 RNA polymerase sigma-70 factor (family 1) [Flavobacterium sp. SORGH_AS_0622]TDX12743.1 RNA polymerase sigma-70 factor (ECF subfamily) [Flavobacterium sp. S87F.05.LMB.W.Kidney.N]BDU27072.1 RNA polymerase sigma factor [Flavobacterium sp. GSB-24]
MYKKFTDEELVELLRNGKDKAFDELYFRYRDILVRFVYLRMKSVAISEEIVQEVFTSIWERRKTIVIQKSFAAYIYTSVRYMTLDYIKSHTVADQYVQEVLDRNTVSYGSHNATEDSIYYDELQKAVDKAAMLLPKKSKEVFILSRVKHYTNKEIAEELNVSIETVKYHITYALKFMRTYLGEFN